MSGEREHSSLPATLDENTYLIASYCIYEVLCAK